MVPGVYGIGDAHGKIMLAHAASAQGISAFKNICGGAYRCCWNSIPFPEIAFLQVFAPQSAAPQIYSTNEDEAESEEVEEECDAAERRNEAARRVQCGDTRCSWSPTDCGPGEDWTFPANGCTYDKVWVGGCLTDWGVVYCAVSRDGCDDKSTYLTPWNVASRTGSECYMGMEVSGPAPPADAAGTVDAGAAAGTPRASDARETVPAALPAPEGGAKGPRLPLVVGATVGGVLAASLLFYAGVFFRRRGLAGAGGMKSGKSASTDVPPEELAADDDDVVSTLADYNYQL